MPKDYSNPPALALLTAALCRAKPAALGWAYPSEHAAELIDIANRWRRYRSDPRHPTRGRWNAQASVQDEQRANALASIYGATVDRWTHCSSTYALQLQFPVSARDPAGWVFNF